MKNKSQWMKNTIMVLFSTLSTALIGTAQQNNLKHEVIVYILPDSLELPLLQKGHLAMNKVTIKSGKLQRNFSVIKPISIAKSFPEWNEKDSIRTREDGQKVRTPSFSRIFTLTFANEQAVDSAIAVLKKSPAVLFAEKHTNPKLFADPRYDDGTQWHLRNDGRNSGIPGADINAANAWQVFTGSTGITIGIIDSGVELTHDEMTGKASGDATLGVAHGTHVAGIAAGNANNGAGGRGVDWNARILSKRIFDQTGDDYIGDVSASSKITDAINAGAHILNHSWGGPDYSSVLASAFAYAYKMNRTSVVSMGNTYDATTQYPAGYNNVIAVGATDNNDQHSSFSSTGTHIDVSAPGGSGITNVPVRDIYSSILNNSYAYLAGTSQAAPQATGLASLLKGYNMALANDDIENIVKLSADKVGGVVYTNGFSNIMGYGRINARKALDYLRAPYALHQWTTSGGTDVASVGYYNSIIYLASGLVDGAYVVKRHEVRKTVAFPQPFCVITSAWGRGAFSTGWSLANPNYSEGFCEIVPGTLSKSGATLRTYVYEVTNVLGQPLGWYPTQPANVVFAYSALGIPDPAPNISLSGSDQVCPVGIPSSTYSVSNLPTSGFAVTWSSSNTSVATINSATGVVTRTGWGNATLTATVSIGANCPTAIITKNIWAGFPPVPSITGPTSLCPNSGGVYTAYVPNYTGYLGNATFGWSYSGLTLASGNTSTSNPIALQTPYNFNGGSIQAFAFNQCGVSSAPASIGITKPYNCPNGLVAAYVAVPNPASGSVSILAMANSSLLQTASTDSVAVPSQNTTTDNTLPEIVSVKIYDRGLQLRKEFKNQKIKDKVNLAGLESGLYYMDITDTSGTTKIQLVVE